MSVLDAVASWPVGHAAVAVVTPGRISEVTGPLGRTFAWASVTKVLTAMAAWVAVEEGTIAWDEPAGPPGSTIRHLLAHASGLATEAASDGTDEVVGPPGTRRLYSNRGIDLVAERLGASAAMPFADYLREAVLDPLGMTATTLTGRPATSAEGPLADLVRLAGELLRPRLVAAETLQLATSVAFPGLVGILPGFGRQAPNDWGLGVEIRGTKSPHWTATRGSPRTFGHFGQSGAFLWVDPDADVACCALTDRAFGPWAADAWPALSDMVLAAHAVPPAAM